MSLYTLQPCVYNCPLDWSFKAKCDCNFFIYFFNTKRQHNYRQKKNITWIHTSHFKCSLPQNRFQKKGKMRKINLPKEKINANFTSQLLHYWTCLEIYMHYMRISLQILPWILFFALQPAAFLQQIGTLLILYPMWNPALERCRNMMKLAWPKWEYGLNTNSRGRLQ